MKKLFSTAILLATTSFYAQDGKVGIGNTDPKATFDVTGNATTTTAADGIIAPRLTGNQLAAKDAVYLADQTGAQVYITAAATAPAGKTINVNAPGYYYFDGTVWQKVANGRPCKFVDGINIADAVYTSGNVGIGTNNPSYKLHIQNSNNALIGIDAQGGFYSGINFLLPNAQFYLGSLSNGSNPRFALNDYINNAERFTVLTNGNVGIGTTTPNENLHVVGDIQITGKIRLGGDATTTGGDLGTDGQVLTSAGPTSSAKWTNVNTLSGILVNSYNLIGTTTQNVSTGTTVDVNGLSQTIIVPNGQTRVFIITATGFATQQSSTDQSSQGAFGIIVNGSKISSGYVSSQNANTGTASLVRLPTPITFSKTITLGAGTHTIKLNFKSWFSNQTINLDPFASGYSGSDAGDSEALKSRLTILEFAQ